MNINSTAYGQIVLVLAIITTIILAIQYKDKKKNWFLLVNFTLNLIQPIGIIYFFFKVKYPQRKVK